MKTYKVSRTTILHQIEIKAEDERELNELYSDGFIDEVLNEKNEITTIIITDEKGNVIREEQYT